MLLSLPPGTCTSTSRWFFMCHPIEQPMEGQRMGMRLHAFTQVLLVPFCHVPRAQSPAMPLSIYLSSIHHIHHVLQGWMLIL